MQSFENDQDLWFLPEEENTAKYFHSQNWAITQLGKPEAWDGTLKQFAATLLSSPVPGFIAWGEDYYVINNLPFSRLTENSSWLQGNSLIKELPLEWAKLEPAFKAARQGRAVHLKDAKLIVNRDMSEVDIDLHLSTVRDHTGRIKGVL